MKKKISAVVGALLGFGASLASAQDQKATEDLTNRAVHVCNKCHGEGGVSTDPNVPSLAGQQTVYLVEQQKLFREQRRNEISSEAYMWGISALLDNATIQALSDYYAAQKAPSGKPASPQLMEKGKAVYERRIEVAKGKYKSCADCHGEQGEGATAIPRVAGQNAPYLLNQLQRSFQTPTRPSAKVMTAVSHSLSKEDLVAVTAFMQAMNAK
jgi:cytochrome c553